MKILTNLQSSNVAGIAAVMKSIFDNSLHVDKKIKFVGVNLQPQISSPAIDKDANLKMIVDKAMYPGVAQAAQNAANIIEMESAYEALISKYSDIITMEKPDLVVLNGTYFQPWALHLAARKLNIPTLLHYHGILTKETQLFPDHSRKIFLEMERSFDTGTMYYLFPSNLSKKIVEEEVFGHEIAKSAIIPNPIANIFFTKRHTKPKRSIKVGAVGRWTAIKNTDFIENFANLLVKKGNNKLQLISDRSNRNSNAHDIDSIVFKKSVPQENLPQFYQGQSVILSPSFFETFGNVPFEALATGTPALVNSNMGVSEVYRELGLADWVVDFENPSEIYDKVVEVSKTRVPKHTISMLEDAYSSEMYTKKYLNLVKNI